MTKTNNLVIFDPYKVKLNQRLKDLEFKYQIRRIEINEDESISVEEKDWKIRLLIKEFNHDKYWTKKMLELYDKIMKME